MSTADIKDALRLFRDRYQTQVAPHLHPLDAYASAYVYGNTAGVQTNLAGDLAELRCRLLAKDTMPHGAPDGLAVNLRREGYADLSEPYDVDLIGRIRDRFDEVIEDEEHSEVVHREDPGDGNVYLRDLTSPMKSVPAFAELITDEIRAILHAYYGAHFQIRTMRAYRTRHIPPEIVQTTDVYNDYWHLDGKATDHVKLFVALSGTTERDGPLHIMPKPDTRRIARRRPTYDRDRDGKPGGFVDENGDAVTLTGPAGSALLGNSQACFHRAGIPEEGRTRDLVQFYIAPAVEPWPKNWDADDLPNSTSPGGLLRPVRY